MVCFGEFAGGGCLPEMSAWGMAALGCLGPTMK